jgi:hypothetical protein
MIVVGTVVGGVGAPHGVEGSGRVTYPVGGAPSGPWASGRFAPTYIRCSVQPSLDRSTAQDTPTSITVAVGSISHQRWSGDCMKSIVAVAGFATRGTHTAVVSAWVATAA